MTRRQGHHKDPHVDAEDANPHARRDERDYATMRRDFKYRLQAKQWQGDYDAGSSIYFIQAVTGGPIKIGFSAQHPESRLYSLQVGNPEELQIIATMSGTKNFEKEVHRRFYKHHIRGEWFRDDPEIKGFISERAAPTPPEATQHEHTWKPAQGQVMTYRCSLCKRKGRKSLKTGVIHAYGQRTAYSADD